MNAITETLVSAAGVDVGFYATKYSCYRRAPGSGPGSIQTDCFPSLAPRQNGAMFRLPSTETVDAIEVEVEPNVVHLVGKGSEHHINGYGTTAVTSEYSRTTGYKALFLGALHGIARANAVKGDMVIQTLVAGLPLSSVRTHAAELRAFVQQEHQVPHPADKDRVLRISVRNAMVMAQPQGALMAYQVSQGKIDRKSTTLVLDMGGGTFDWYVALGASPNMARSGAAPIGALACATAICNKIDPELKNIPEIMSRVDYALRTNAESFTVSATSYRLDQYKGIVQGVLSDAVQQMMKSVGSLRVMDTILFTGGAAPVLFDACQDQFSKLKVPMLLDDEPVTSNVRGFHIWAEQVNAHQKAVSQ